MKDTLDKYLTEIDGTFVVSHLLFVNEEHFSEEMPALAGITKNEFYSLLEYVQIIEINTLLTALQRLHMLAGVEAPRKRFYKNINGKWFIRVDLKDHSVDFSRGFSTSIPNNHDSFVDDQGFWCSYKCLLSIINLKKIFDSKKGKSARGEFKTYLMIDEHSSLIKIGRSISPSVREDTLGAQVPRIKLLFTLDKDIEMELHSIFKNKRVRGEWFRLSMDEVLDIANKYGFKPIKR